MLWVPSKYSFSIFDFCSIIHTHDGACPSNGGSVIQDQRRAQSSPYPVSPFDQFKLCIKTALVPINYGHWEKRIAHSKLNEGWSNLTNIFGKHRVNRLQGNSVAQINLCPIQVFNHKEILDMQSNSLSPITFWDFKIIVAVSLFFFHN